MTKLVSGLLIGLGLGVAILMGAQIAAADVATSNALSTTMDSSIGRNQDIVNAASELG